MTNAHNKKANRTIHRDGVMATPEQRAALGAYMRGKSEKSLITSLSTQVYTLHKIVDGIGVKQSALDNVMAGIGGPR